MAPQGNNKYDAKNLYDLNPLSAWVEGVKGQGIGEYVVYTLDQVNVPISSINIKNGYVKNETAWKNNSRVKKLKVYYNNKPVAILNLQDSRTEQVFDVKALKLNLLGKEIQQSFSIKFEILDVYPGAKYEDTAISEISFGDCY